MPSGVILMKLSKMHFGGMEIYLCFLMFQTQLTGTFLVHAPAQR